MVMVNEVPEMGRKKKQPAEDGGAPVFRTVQVRGSVEWVEWLEEYARYLRSDVSKVIDLALISDARVRGFPKPPPERLG